MQAFAIIFVSFACKDFDIIFLLLVLSFFFLQRHLFLSSKQDYHFPTDVH